VQPSGVAEQQAFSWAQPDGFQVLSDHGAQQRDGEGGID
jgi:hypothetical protein